MAEDQVNEALEKLNRGIEESKQMVQQQTMQLAQDFFGDSVEEIKQQIKDNRSTLEKLPDQIPGGQEEAFQMLFQELMDNYAAVEQALEEAEKNVSNLDTDSLVKQGEVNASDAARREARDLEVDLTEVEGSGSGGRIIVSDVVQASEEAAKRKAEELGIDLSEIQGTGSGGVVTVKDVTSFAEEAGDQATEAAGEAGDQATETAGQATQAVEETAGQAAGQADGAAGQAAQEAGQAAGQAAGGENGSEGPKATNAAQRRAEEMGIDLSTLKGSGAGGLITVKDVVKA